MTDLTNKQQAVLDYIRAYMSSHGVTPTSRQIQVRFRWASQTTAMSNLNALLKKGLIKRSGRRYGLVGPVVQWEDVQPLVRTPDGRSGCRSSDEELAALKSFYAKYPHLKP